MNVNETETGVVITVSVLHISNRTEFMAPPTFAHATLVPAVRSTGSLLVVLSLEHMKDH